MADHEVIEQDGNAVGCVASIWHDDHLFIEKLYISLSFQGRGIGAQVLKAKSDQAAQRGLPTKLSVLLTTNLADRFYRREGFVQEAETPERRRFSKGCADILISSPEGRADRERRVPDVNPDPGDEIVDPED
ncbi:hypothetical protein AM571_CH02424 [Rhizobium etli 8C-3]|uniref:N-acetyltransferase domain-containing protein n=1 Tax=Rhizobium etli 8C-3 TaxID=538025 RepID=A0A1L5P510_RHIET|nr:GNAT family N-acetyltransferase [Rhizobium etli]APO75233.1 hypothetical protein AM571_CH02424 [Rhizobium etli 8C-3]